MEDGEGCLILCDQCSRQNQLVLRGLVDDVTVIELPNSIINMNIEGLFH